MRMPPQPLPTLTASLSGQPFFGSTAARVGLARERFFGDGVRPTGLVPETVIQSWTRCWHERRAPREAIGFDPITRGRTGAVLERSRRLLVAAGDGLARLEAALAGTGCRVLLTDRDGIVVHATQADACGGESVLPLAARVGVDLAESTVGTNAPALVAKTGQACTVYGAEHYFDTMAVLHCAAAPLRDADGRVAGVLDLTIEGRAFGFDAAALVGVYATAIENRLLCDAPGTELLLQLELDAPWLGHAPEALVGIDTAGRIAWLNAAARRLLAPRAGGVATADAAALPGPIDVETLLQCTPAALEMLCGASASARIRVASGLVVRLRVRRRVEAPTIASSATQGAADLRPSVQPPGAARERLAGTANAPEAVRTRPAGETLGAHTRQFIERQLAECGGNVSAAARALGVSRGLLYRRLRAWNARPAGSRTAPGAQPPPL